MKNIFTLVIYNYTRYSVDYISMFITYTLLLVPLYFLTNNYFVIAGIFTSETITFFAKFRKDFLPFGFLKVNYQRVFFMYLFESIFYTFAIPVSFFILSVFNLITHPTFLGEVMIMGFTFILSLKLSLYVIWITCNNNVGWISHTLLSGLSAGIATTITELYSVGYFHFTHIIAIYPLITYLTYKLILDAYLRKELGNHE